MPSDGVPSEDAPMPLDAEAPWHTVARLMSIVEERAIKLGITCSRGLPDAAEIHEAERCLAAARGACLSALGAFIPAERRQPPSLKAGGR